MGWNEGYLSFITGVLVCHNHEWCVYIGCFSINWRWRIWIWDPLFLDTYRYKVWKKKMFIKHLKSQSKRNFKCFCLLKGKLELVWAVGKVFWKGEKCYLLRLGGDWDRGWALASRKSLESRGTFLFHVISILSSVAGITSCCFNLTGCLRT